MTPEQLRIYNENRRRTRRPLIRADGTETTDPIDVFQQEVDEVTPYTTGLQTTVDDPDYAKNIKQELDWISNSTQYLFNAVNAGQEAYNNAQQAATDATNAYNAAQAAQSAADAAQDDATSALQDFEAQQQTLDQQQKEINANTQTGIDNATAAAAASQAAADAATAASQANSQAISALQQAGATSSATAIFNGDETHSITIKAWTQSDKDSGIATDRMITLLPCVVGGIGGGSAHSASLSVSLDGSTLYSEDTGMMSDGYSGYLAYSHAFTAGVNDGDHTYTVTMHNGGLDHAARTNMTVMATRNYSAGFVVS